jgi:hypothetical protein
MILLMNGVGLVGSALAEHFTATRRRPVSNPWELFTPSRTRA